MVFDKNKKYTSLDFDKWCEDGYFGMECLDGIPIQCGVSVFEKKPFRFTKEILNKIIINFCDKFSEALKDTQFKTHCNYPITLTDTFFNNGESLEIISDIVIKDSITDDIILVADLALSRPKHSVLIQNLSNKDGFEYWIIRFMPNNECITVQTSNDHKGHFDINAKIPIANTGYWIDLNNVWEMPIYDC